MGEHGASDRGVAHGYVRHLCAHADDKGEVEEIPIVRLGAIAGKLETAALAAPLVVVFVGIVQAENDVGECPGQGDRRYRKDEMKRRSSGLLGRAKQGKYRREAGERGDCRK